MYEESSRNTDTIIEIHDLYTHVFCPKGLFSMQF